MSSALVAGIRGVLRIVMQGMVEHYWLGVGINGVKIGRGKNKWKESAVIIDATVILAEALIRVAIGRRWDKLRRWLPQLENRVGQMDVEGGSYIYMIVETATGRCYCGETGQTLRQRWYQHVTKVSQCIRNRAAVKDSFYRLIARQGLSKYVFIPWQKLTMGGQDTRKRLEKLIIFQLPATLNVEYHAAQHGLSDARNEHRIRRNRRRSRWAHCRSGSEKRILDTRLTEYRIRGSEITNGALDLLGKVLEANMVVLKCKRTVDVTDFRALRNTFGNSRLTLIRDTRHLITGTLKDPAMRLALKEADRLEIHEWVDEVAVRNANAAGGHADLSELKIRYGSFGCWMKAGTEGELGMERKQRILDMWEAFQAEQLTLPAGTLEHVRKRLRLLSKRFLGFVPACALHCFVRRHHQIDTKQMHGVIRDMLEESEVPKTLRRHMYDLVRVTQLRRKTVSRGLAVHIKFAETIQYDEEPKCTCARAGGNFQRINGHVCMRGNEYKGGNKRVRRVLNGNAGDNVHPAEDRDDLRQEIARALRAVQAKMGKYCQFRQETTTEMYWTEQADRCIKRNAGEWEIPEGGITEKDIRTTRAWLKGKGLIASVIDKNKASLCIMCPVMLYRVLVKMYPIGQTYARVREAESAILDKMAGSAAKVFGQVIGVKLKEKEGRKTPIAEQMRNKLKHLPRAYAFPKDKNLEKGRPIVPYRKHGLRRVLQAAARALLYVVEKLEASGQLETFTLKTCTDLGKTLIQINETMTVCEKWRTGMGGAER